MFDRLWGTSPKLPGHAAQWTQQGGPILLPQETWLAASQAWPGAGSGADIRFLALVGKAEIILSVALKNSTLLSLNQTASKSSTLTELGFRLYVENIFTTLSHSLASQFVERVFSSFDWPQRWFFSPCEPLSFAVLRCKVVNVHGGFRHTCDPFSNTS